MSSIGSLRLEILVKVGDGEPVGMGEITVPLKASLMNGNTLVVETREAIEYVAESLKQVFGGEDR